MTGSIRVILGLLMTFGAIGGLDADQSANELVQILLALSGLLLVYSGVLAYQSEKNG